MRISYTSRLAVTVEPGGEILLRNIKLRPLDTKPLFNGKDLDRLEGERGRPEAEASKFEVTKDGEFASRTGPATSSAEKEFDNFVLQFECKTNGKASTAASSSAASPGQYQNGYEAQIQNAFKDDDRTKPVDFGTGAIYRRVPARKVVSNDNEWFTMTVVADGKHIATWVNGYQTVDWTDDRKANENPRQGYRAAKGPLSIQGHDPTTDLLFRNIRIARVVQKSERHTGADVSAENRIRRSSVRLSSSLACLAFVPVCCSSVRAVSSGRRLLRRRTSASSNTIRSLRCPSPCSRSARGWRRPSRPRRGSAA